MIRYYTTIIIVLWTSHSPFVTKVWKLCFFQYHHELTNTVQSKAWLVDYGNIYCVPGQWINTQGQSPAWRSVRVDTFRIYMHVAKSILLKYHSRIVKVIIIFYINPFKLVHLTWTAIFCTRLNNVPCIWLEVRPSALAWVRSGGELITHKFVIEDAWSKIYTMWQGSDGYNLVRHLLHCVGNIFWHSAVWIKGAGKAVRWSARRYVLSQ